MSERHAATAKCKALSHAIMWRVPLESSASFGEEVFFWPGIFAGYLSLLTRMPVMAWGWNRGGE
jgi:hypothetical protein